MKGKGIVKGTFVFVAIFMIVAVYFWYLFFNEGYQDLKMGNTKIIDKTESGLVLESVNTLNLVNEETHEDGSGVAGYTFRLTNKGTKNLKYTIYIEDVPYNVINDGCSNILTLEREELSYQLFKNKKVISSGNLDEIEDNILEDDSINANVVNDYELKIWINEDTEDWQAKHYHYKLSLKEV